MSGWVFGYASLVADYAAEPGARICVLPGYRRGLGVAADNADIPPGYKVYLDRTDGSRPAVFVAFVDLIEDPASEVTGVAIPVDGERLGALDRRERNYDRTDISGAIDGLAGDIWTYIGSAAGRERLQRGRAAGRAVVSRDYVDRVTDAFRALGNEQFARFEASTVLDDLPVRDLDRLDPDEALRRSA